MTVRVFEGFEAHGAEPPTRTTPLALDVDLELVTCPDGNTQVNRMTLGGAPYEPHNPGRDCTTSSGSGSVQVHDGQPREITATAGTPVPAEKQPTPRCDPATWRCADPAAAPATAPAR